MSKHKTKTKTKTKATKKKLHTYIGVGWSRDEAPSYFFVVEAPGIEEAEMAGSSYVQSHSKDHESYVEALGDLPRVRYVEPPPATPPPCHEVVTYNV